MTNKKNNLDVEYDAIKSKLDCLDINSAMDVILNKMMQIELDLSSPLAKGKRPPKLIW